MINGHVMCNCNDGHHCKGGKKIFLRVEKKGESEEPFENSIGGLDDCNDDNFSLEPQTNENTLPPCTSSASVININSTFNAGQNSHSGNTIQGDIEIGATHTLRFKIK